MRRRQFIGTLGAGAIVASPAGAQRTGMPVIGFLSLISEAGLSDQLPAFHAGLAETGFAVGRNVAIDYRWADGRIEALPALAAELVKIPVNVIVAAGGNVSAEAAKAATTRIPIVFTAVSDPVQAGLVASFNRPGGNVTGVSILSQELDAKRLELTSELAPGKGPIGVLVNPKNPNTDYQRRMFREAAAAAGRTLVFAQAGTPADLPGAFTALSKEGVTALVVGADPFLTGERRQITALAARARVPAMYQWRLFVVDGGLASYGPNFGDAYRQSGMLVGRILRGESPATLPVIQPTKFELVLNLKAAREQGITLPSPLLARADELIE